MLVVKFNGNGTVLRTKNVGKHTDDLALVLVVSIGETDEETLIPVTRDGTITMKWDCWMTRVSSFNQHG